MTVFGGVAPLVTDLWLLARTWRKTSERNHRNKPKNKQNKPKTKAEYEFARARSYLHIQIIKTN